MSEQQEYQDAIERARARESAEIDARQRSLNPSYGTDYSYVAEPYVETPWVPDTRGTLAPDQSHTYPEIVPAEPYVEIPWVPDNRGPARPDKTYE